MWFIVVSITAFYSDDLSSIPAGYQNFQCSHAEANMNNTRGQSCPASKNELSIIQLSFVSFVGCASKIDEASAFEGHESKLIAPENEKRRDLPRD